MTDKKTEETAKGLVFECEIDEPPQKVWRAISIPAFRENWLPKQALADPEATSVTPGQEVRYRMRDDDPPFLESVVTFQISPNAAGGTSFRVIHEIADARIAPTTVAANSNSTPVMLAA
ncbi:SRPBCC family protein [Rhizobium tubonense]|uniref:Polyketide cyclase n=1 Tax=Rhizobium tubonense TaxID=484088 RepID=A0A2W4D1F0_9HYPH|nr:SRPBCC domain-containing protein [Rhizobium tubonense]PZM17241.1 hypothetical protein CPY51_03170 [Rhizobium tubonense]